MNDRIASSARLSMDGFSSYATIIEKYQIPISVYMEYSTHIIADSLG